MTLVEPQLDRTCLRCGYDLRGQIEQRCPECGLEFDPDAPPAPAVPWMRRHQIGRVNAYMQTVFLVLLHPQKFAEQAWRWTRCDPADGERFWQVTVFIATLSVIIAIVAIEWIVPSGLLPFTWVRLPAVVAAWSAPAVFSFFWVATLRLQVPIPSKRRDVQLRFALLQHFGCAGLGLSPLIGLVAVAGAVGSGLGVIDPMLAATLLGATTIVVLIAWLATGAMYLFFAGRVSAMRVAQAMVASLALWMLAAFAAVIVAVITVVTTLAIARPLLR
jgi:hypothetical protein